MKASNGVVLDSFKILISSINTRWLKQLSSLGNWHQVAYQGMITSITPSLQL